MRFTAMVNSSSQTQFLNLHSQHPINFNQLAFYPTENPILIAIDWNSFQFIQRLSGLCLFCNKPAFCYDLTFCFQREVWVLYAQQKHFLRAMQLAHAIQQQGAAKIIAIRINPSIEN